MPAALIAMSILQMGLSQQQQSAQMRAARKAERRSQDEAIANQNKLIAEQDRKRKQQGSVLGGVSSGTAGAASQQGTILSSPTQKKSLLG